MSSLIVKHLSWVILWWRAENHDSVIKGYQVKLQDALKMPLPNPIQNFFYKPTFGCKGLKKARVHAQDDIIEWGKSDQSLLSDLLFVKPFIFGNELTLLDVVAFANLVQLHYISKEVENPLRDAINGSFPNLVGLVPRVLERAVPDWKELVSPVAAAPLPIAVKDNENKEATTLAEMQPLNCEPEKDKGDEKEKEQEKEPEEKNGKENEKEK